ncbi:MAG: immunoglobulin-like domain-containing protein [Mycoplasmatales bacterium]
MKLSKKLSMLVFATFLSTTAAPIVELSAENVKNSANQVPIFTPYVDMGSMSNDDLSTYPANDNYIYSFLNSTGKCQASWAGFESYYKNAPMGRENYIKNNADIVTLSFGGANAGIVANKANSDLAVTCNTANDLAAAIIDMVDHYGADYVDFDIESFLQSVPESIDKKRVDAIKIIQKERPNVKFIFTLPVSTNGLVDEVSGGLKVMRNTIANGFKPEYINIMTMDYGTGVKDMGKAAVNAVDKTAGQISKMYGESVERSYQRIGSIPMIGVQDTTASTGDAHFTLKDVEVVVEHAAKNKIHSLGFWSVGRDKPGAYNIVDSGHSGTNEAKYAYAKKFQSELDKYTPNDTQAPTTPTSVKSTLKTDRVEVAFSAATDNNAVSKYRLYRNGKQVVESNKLLLNDFGVKSNGTYSYQVSALDRKGNESPKSSTICVKTATVNIQAEQYNQASEYRVKGTIVVQNGTYYESQWYVNPGESPGKIQGQWKVVDAKKGTETENSNCSTTSPENQAPTFRGTENKTIFVNDAFDPNAGVSVSDDHDQNLSFRIVNNNLNVNVPGTYTITYEAKDSGNLTTRVERRIQVNSRPVVNTAPKFNGVNDVAIYVGDSFNPEYGVTVTDDHDQNLRFRITQNNVDTAKAGNYSVRYEVTDNGGLTTVATRNVIVQARPVVNTVPVINGATDKTIKQGERFDPMFQVTVTDDKDQNLVPRVTNPVNSNVPGVYVVTYEVTDSGGLTTRVSRNIRVEAQTVPTNGIPKLYINPTYLELNENENYDILGGVSAHDDEDGNITNRITYTTNTQEKNKIVITYTVLDSVGARASGTRTIVFKQTEKPTVIGLIGTKNTTIDFGSQFNPMAGVKAYSVNGDDITNSVAVTGQVNSNVAGLYKLTYTVKINNIDQKKERNIIVKSQNDYNNSTVYPGSGFVVNYNGHVYQSKWYINGATPDQNANGLGNDCWTLLDPDVNDDNIAKYLDAKAYVFGEKVVYNNVVYEAKFWTKSARPDQNSNGAGTNAWKVIK